jgi:hypothetical protein
MLDYITLCYVTLYETPMVWLCLAVVEVAKSFQGNNIHMQIN